MTRNEKLAHALSGKTIASTAYGDDGRTVRLSDGSTLTVHTNDAPLSFQPSSADVSSSPIAAAWEAGTTLRLGLSSGTTIDFPLTEEGAAVLVRDASGKVVYAG